MTRLSRLNDMNEHRLKWRQLRDIVIGTATSKVPLSQLWLIWFKFLWSNLVKRRFNFKRRRYGIALSSFYFILYLFCTAYINNVGVLAWKLHHSLNRNMTMHCRFTVSLNNATFVGFPKINNYAMKTIIK